MEKVETASGTDVWIISEGELQYPRKVGKEYRARCPIHGSKDRDLGYVAEGYEKAGWGRCYGANCNAVVFVAELNPEVANNMLKADANRKQRKVELFRPGKQRQAPKEEATPIEGWQLREQQGLDQLAPRAIEKLTHPRAQAYLRARGLEGEKVYQLLTSLGVGYLPPIQSWHKPPSDEIKKWCDYIIFPCTRLDGTTGYIGRRLEYWVEGMDENEHREIFKEKGIPPYRKTHSMEGALFNKQGIIYNHVILTEGTFDCIPFLLTGLPNVVALAGISFSIKSFPAATTEITLAFDLDTKDSERIAEKVRELRRKGFDVTHRTPPADGLGKDWSERYRNAEEEGLRALFEGVLAKPQQPEPELLTCQCCFERSTSLYPYQDGEATISVCEACLDTITMPDLCECGEVAVGHNNGMNYCEAHKPAPVASEPSAAPNLLDEMLNIFGGSYTMHPLGTDTKALWREEQAQEKQIKNTGSSVSRPEACQDCVAEVKHPQVPWWYTDPSKKQKYAREYKTFKAGHKDSRGNWWCGHCYDRYQLMEYGERHGYPEGNSIYRYAGLGAGYDAWLAFAQGASVTQVAELLRMIDRSKIHAGMIVSI